MTIAIGLVARDGMVVAADTELTSWWKLDHGKVSACGHKTIDGYRHCLLTGAGTHAHLSTVWRRLMETFQADKTRADDDIYGELLNVIRPYYQKRIAGPYATWPAAERPDIQILIAVSTPSHDHIYRSEQNTLNRGEPYTAVGIGADMALTILGRMYRLPMLDVPNAILLASYVMGQVKASIAGCGKETDIAYIRGSSFGSFRRTDSAMLEAALMDYVEYAEADAFRRALGDDGWEHGAKRAKAARDTLGGLLDRLRADEHYQILK